MSKASNITIIDDKNLRGIVGPASLISKEMLEDFIEAAEHTEPAFVAEMKKLKKESARKKDWIPFQEVARRAKNAR